MLYSGIELHKRSLGIHTIDADRATAREAELKSDRVDARMLAQLLRAGLIPEAP